MLELSEEQEKEIVAYLKEEIKAAYSERAGKEELWKKWRRQREARPEHEVKTYPFKSHSSNIAVPLSAMNAQTNFGHLISTFNVKKPFWTIEALRDDEADRELAKVGTKYMEILSKSKHDLDFSSQRRYVLYESGTLGTCFVKVTWNKEKWNFKYVDDDGNTVQVDSVLHDGPSIEPIPMEDFLYREAWQDIEQAPWVDHIVHLPWHEVAMRGELGTYVGVEDIKAHGRTEVQDHVSEDNRRRGVEQGVSEIYDIHEIWLKWDVDEDGVYEDIIITFHLESGVVLSSKFNELGVRPFENFKHLLRPGYLDGIGTCWMSEHMQDEADMWHNLRGDSAKLSVLRMFAVKRNAGIAPNEQLYPGKLWFVDNPKEDIISLAVPDVSPSSFEAEDRAMQYSQRATGLPDIMAGFANSTLKTRDAGVMQQQRMSQSQGVFSSITEGIGESFSVVGMYVFFWLVRNKEVVLENERRIGRLSEEDQGKLAELLNIKYEDIPMRLKFSVRTTDIEKTFETRRANYLTLAQLYSTFWQQVTPVVMQLFGPQGQQMQQGNPKMYGYMLKIYEGACRLMEKIFEFFGEDDTQDYIPDYEREVALFELQQALMGQMGEMRRMNNGSRELPRPGGGPEEAGGPGAGGAGQAVPGAGGVSGMGVGPQSPDQFIGTVS